jgi:hypothetical protein
LRTSRSLALGTSDPRERRCDCATNSFVSEFAESGVAPSCRPLAPAGPPRHTRGMGEEEDYADDSRVPARLGLVEYVDALRAGLAECFVALVVGVLLLSVIGGGALVVFVLVTHP